MGPFAQLPPAEQRILEDIIGTGSYFTMSPNCPPLPDTAEFIPPTDLFRCAPKTHLPAHFLLASGRHAEAFLLMRLALRFAHVSYRIATRIKEKLTEEKLLSEIEVIVGPAMGALPLIYAILHVINRPNVEAIYAEKCGKDPEDNKDRFRLAGGFSVSEKRVFIVDDVGTTFGSVKGTLDACEQFCIAHETGYFPLGVGVGVNRSAASSPHLNVRAPALTIVSALTLPIEDCAPHECQPCRDGHPLVKI